MVHLLSVVLEELHDRPDYLAALQPVVVECCHWLAYFATEQPTVFASAVERLTALAQRLAAGPSDCGSMLSECFAELVADDALQPEMRVVFCLLAATADSCTPETQHSHSPGAEETSRSLPELLSVALQCSSFAAAAAQALGAGFAAVGPGCSYRQDLLTSLISTAMQQHTLCGRGSAWMTRPQEGSQGEADVYSEDSDVHQRRLEDMRNDYDPFADLH